MDPVVALSEDVCIYLFSFFNGKELAQRSLVSKGWRTLVTDNLLWKGLCTRTFAIRNNKEGDDWRQLYIERLRVQKAVHATCLSHTEINRYLMRLHKNKLRCRYVGSGKGDDTFGGVQTEHPLKRLPYGDTCFVVYYEVTVTAAGESGHISLGIGLNGFPRSNAPAGWRKGTYGYHGDDGRLYLEAGFGKVWGPTYTTGDIIGCGVNCTNGELFYSKNGQYLGVAAKRLQYCDFFHAVAALHSVSSSLSFNFGQENFVFDIAAHILHLQELEATKDKGESTEEETSTSDGENEVTSDNGQEDDAGEKAKKQPEKADRKGKAKILEEEEDEGDEDTEPFIPAVDYQHMDPLDDILQKINDPDAAKDEEFVEYCRDQIRALQAPELDASTMSPAELFETLQALADFVRAHTADNEDWELAPTVARPVISLLNYQGVLEELRLLRDSNTPDTSPAIQGHIQAHQSIAELPEYFGVEGWARLSDREKRLWLTAEASLTADYYESAICKRDMAILKRKNCTADKKDRAMRRWGRQILAARPNLTARELDELIRRGDPAFIAGAVTVIQEQERMLTRRINIWHKIARGIGKKQGAPWFADWLWHRAAAAAKRHYLGRVPILLAGEAITQLYMRAKIAVLTLRESDGTGQ